MMMPLLHKITHSEIRYGILNLTQSDHIQEFFKSLPERFNVKLKDSVLYERTISVNKIWMGYTIMRKFNPGDTARIYQEEGFVVIE